MNPALSPFGHVTFPRNSDRFPKNNPELRGFTQHSPRVATRKVTGQDITSELRRSKSEKPKAAPEIADLERTSVSPQKLRQEQIVVKMSLDRSVSESLEE